MTMPQHITVILRNTPGEIATLTKLLKSEEVNILAFHLAAFASNTGYVQLICDNQIKALLVLNGAYGCFAYASEVIAFQAKNASDALFEIFTTLLLAKVNIEAAYQSLGPLGQLITILEPSANDLERAKAAVADRDDLISDFQTICQ
jgi:hypothetical protein